MSLRTRLVLTAAYLLSVVVVVLEVPLALSVERRATSEFESSVLGNAAIVAAQVSDEVAEAQRGGAGAAPEPPARISAIVQENAGTIGARIVVVDRDGRMLADSSGAVPVGEPFLTVESLELVPALRDGRIETVRRFVEAAGEEQLLVAVPVSDQEQVVGAVRISESLGQVNAQVRRSWLGLGLIGALVVAIGLALAWFLAGSLARPVRRLERVAVRLGQGDLEARAVPEGPKELSTLARSFNQMAGAFSANLAAQRDFVANASHQLRSPLTGIRLRLEAIEQEGGFGAEQARKAQSEVDRLAELVEDLLQLARASSVETTGSPVDLVRAAGSAVDRWTGPAEDAGHALRLVAGPPAIAWTHPDDLDHVLDNLVENAVRYCPAGAEIVVEAGQRDGLPTLRVADDGPGIPPEERDRVFQRFYRGSTGRRAGAGSGLGLAIVAELVRRWGGEVRLGDGDGTWIEATFPASLPSLNPALNPRLERQS